jgi:hypothetical protein
VAAVEPIGRELRGERGDHVARAGRQHEQQAAPAPQRVGRRRERGQPAQRNGDPCLAAHLVGVGRRRQRDRRDARDQRCHREHLARAHRLA